MKHRTRFALIVCALCACAARRGAANGLCPLCMIKRPCGDGERRKAATSARSAPCLSRYCATALLWRAVGATPQHVQSLSQGKNRQRGRSPFGNPLKGGTVDADFSVGLRFWLRRIETPTPWVWTEIRVRDACTGNAPQARRRRECGVPRARTRRRTLLDADV
jgi:hypothetical protein